MANSNALSGMAHWLVHTGIYFIIIFLVFFLPVWAELGWSNAWDILVGRISPRRHSYPGLVWPLAVLGWLFVPAFVGAVVGSWVSEKLTARRNTDIENVAEDAAQRAKTIQFAEDTTNRSQTREE